MAIIEKDGKQKELPDGSRIKETCQELEVWFGCEEGVCGTCLIEILEGSENLFPLNDAEKNFDMDLGPKKRLACQCKIKSGKIKIKTDY